MNQSMVFPDDLSGQLTEDAEENGTEALLSCHKHIKSSLIQFENNPEAAENEAEKRRTLSRKINR